MSDFKELFLSHEQIEERAYEFYLERCAGDGHALDDWLAAEKELKTLKKNYYAGDFLIGKEIAAAIRRGGP